MRLSQAILAVFRFLEPVIFVEGQSRHIKPDRPKMAAIVDENYTSLRSRGNLHFVEGKFMEAEELYTKILAEFDNDRAVILTNRSAARLSLGKVNEALDDAQKAIESDRRWTKAYYRKASALEQLKRYLESIVLIRMPEISSIQIIS